jgi:hypothetical protein
MKTIENIKVADYVEIYDTDLMVKNFISDKIFSNLEIPHLRALCSIIENKKYKVSHVCKSCKMVKVKLNKKNIPIKYRYIRSVSCLQR